MIIRKIENKSGGNPRQTELLKRVFRGMEFRDATADMIIHVKSEDIVGAVPNDLEHCVFARTCARMFDSTLMVFMARTAYVDIEDEDGVRRVFRFHLGERMYRAVKKLDEKGLPDSGTYVLKAPSPANRLDTVRAAGKEKRAAPGYKKKQAAGNRRRRAIIKATGRPVKTKNQAGPLGVIRSGSGLFQTKVIEA
jgi:hypothetical protein